MIVTALKTIFSVLALSAVLILSACSTNVDQAQPTIGIDKVTTIDRELVVGQWRSTPLNPPTDAANSHTVIEYRSDGTLQGTILSALDDALSSTPDDTTESAALKLVFKGQWNIKDGWLTHTDVKLSAVGDSQQAKELNLVLGARNQELGNRTNVLELTADKMIPQDIGGRATLYTRQ